mgnify:CR=1 FL=1
MQRHDLPANTTRKAHTINNQALPIGFFCRPAEVVAPELIGCLLIKRQPSRKLLWGVIVETEAYSQAEPACHGHNRCTPSNKTLFGTPGRFYIYLTYGIYHCVNVVTDRKHWANGVLLRAIALPEEPERIASGPGLLARRFELDRSHDSWPVTGENDLWLASRPSAATGQKIVSTTRIGISQAKDLPWRWYLQRSRSVSKRAKGDRCPALSKAWRPAACDGP